MKLYILPGACSFVPHTALEWAGADYELEILDHDSVKSEEYLRINPQGSVPAIVDGDTVISQNLAVQTFINATYPDAHIFGKDDTPADLAYAYHWLAFLNSDLHKAFAPVFGPDGFIKGDDEQKALVAQAKQKIVNLLDYPNKQLGKHDYLTGTKSTADLYLYVILRWSKNFELDLAAYSNLNPFIKRIESDESVTEALRQEGLEKINSL
ncbi:glutathione S-transferase family protein [Psychrobacter sp. FDAARGOS_221]|uniref:glutathione S-transferase family protein n=1 Tax=Psychrobacter sp. FDAARGOS_221 TaxID=1975705 RepID=UPI000BB531CE|nr:glutathione binding-like protein [Psychrobacter sp. FDAARGOS_221]PNK61309.1 glutathione S-transferase [Psychrobacter sp. FDAARGOS_221]